MTPAQTVKEFARRNGMKVNSSGGVPMLSKHIGGGKWFIECFNDYPEAVEFIKKQMSDFERGVITTYPWSNM